MAPEDPEDPEVKVTKVIGSDGKRKHKCDPTHKHVKFRDPVFWSGKEPFLVSFPDDKPFGKRQFGNREPTTVTLQLRPGQTETFKAIFTVEGEELQSEQTEGDIIVEGG